MLKRKSWMNTNTFNKSHKIKSFIDDENVNIFIYLINVSCMNNQATNWFNCIQIAKTLVCLNCLKFTTFTTKEEGIT